MKLLIVATIATLMFGLGLGLRAEAVGALRHRPGLAVRVVLGSCVLMPLAGLLLLSLPPAADVPRGVRLAILAMAICPSAPLSLRRAGRHGGDRELAAGLQLLGAAVAVLTIPLMVQLLQAALRARGWAIPPGLVAVQVLAVQGLPLGLGMALRRRRPAWAAGASQWIDRLAFLLLVALVGVLLVRIGPLLGDFLMSNGIALALMAALVLIATALGGLLGGPGREGRISAAVVTSLRNPGLALLFATLYARGIPGVMLGIVVYQVLTLLLTGPLLRLWRRRAGPPPPAARR
ncbi:MAG: bile acid:sodium symporter family protein [Cyanobium sp.]